MLLLSLPCQQGTTPNQEPGIYSKKLFKKREEDSPQGRTHLFIRYLRFCPFYAKTIHLATIHTHSF